MLEIIVLIFLTKRIGEIAVQKGLPAGWWKFYAVLGWVGGEIIGVVLGIMLFDTDSIFPAFLIGIGGAITGYHIVKTILQKKPDELGSDIDEIGKNTQ